MRYTFAILLASSFIMGCSQSGNETSTTTNSGNESSASEQEQPKTVNVHCPIMGGDVTADGGTVTWNGKLIGFCCSGCDKKWEKLSDEEKAQKLADADKEHGDHDHEHDHDHEKS